MNYLGNDVCRWRRAWQPPTPPVFVIFEINVALPFHCGPQLVATFSVWAQVFRPRLWPVRRHSRFHVRGVSNQLGHMRCIVSHAHRIPLSYHFPGKLSIWILLASVILFAGLTCFFLGCPPGISMFCGPLAPACAADLSQFSPLMTTEDLARKTTSTLLPCLYPICCVRTCPVAFPGRSWLPSSFPGFLAVACTFPPDTQGFLSRSSSVVINKSPGQDVSHDRNGCMTDLRRLRRPFQLCSGLDDKLWTGGTDSQKFSCHHRFRGLRQDFRAPWTSHNPAP